MENMQKLQEELDGLKAAIEEGNEEAMNRAQEILDNDMPKAKRGAALLKTIGTTAVEPEQDEEEDVPAKSLGDFAAKNLKLDALREGDAKSAGTGFAYKAATDAHTAPGIETLSTNVVNVARELEIRRLFGAETISGNSLKYFVMGTTEGAPTTVAEGAAKPQFHIPIDPQTVNLQKIAGWYYETDELLEDAEFLRSSIDARGMYELDKAIEAYLVTTLTNTSGIQSLTPAGSALAADDVFKAIMAVKTGSDFDADAIIINPTDYQTLRLAQDANHQYYGGGYFYGPYGNDTVTRQPGLWGLNTIVSTAVAAGTVLVGAFRQGASVITKANDGRRVEVVTGDHDDRTANRVTVIVEERLALAPRVPAAFVKIAKAS